VQAFQNNKANSFKDKYRKYDVLIMDDIQFIGKMEKTQEELFHTFNTMYENNKQIIFSSDKHPNYIPGLEDRLRSRFSQGMIVDIIEPDFESRVAILKAKAREVGYIVPDEVLQYIAEVVSGNIRELEGSLNSIICQSQIRNKTLSITEVKNVLKNSVKPKEEHFY
jgi:chromosomal replication initiator protein